MLNEVPSELTASVVYIVTFFGWLLSSIGTPTTQVHDFPQRLLWLLHFRIFQFAWNHCRGWRRKVLSLRIRPEIVLGMLLRWPYDKIPPTDPLVFHGFHNSNTGCHNSSACWIHLEFYSSQDCCLASTNDIIRRICDWWSKWNGGSHLYIGRDRRLSGGSYKFGKNQRLIQFCCWFWDLGS